MDYSSYKVLVVEVREGIAFVTINKPEKMNSFDAEEHRELSRILRDLARDDQVKAAVVTGAGRAFSTGGDLDMEQFAANPEILFPLMDDARELIYAHIDLEKPIIAAVNGPAMASAASFALLCDYIIAERQAVFADVHIRAAVVAGDGGALIWPLAAGLTKAKRYLLTGDSITAEEAERIGLVTEVVDQGESLRRATQVAERLVAGPQLAIKYTKRALNQWLRVGATTAFDFSLAVEQLTLLTEEARRAVANMKAHGSGAIPPDRPR